MRKLKFRPKITRVKLNPEQAVLICGCYSIGVQRALPMEYYKLAVATFCTIAPKQVADGLVCELESGPFWERQGTAVAGATSS